MVGARLRPTNGLLKFVISFQNSVINYLAGQLLKSRAAMVPAAHEPNPTFFYDLNSCF